MIEDIRRAEKDVMEIQERALRADYKEDRLELAPWNVHDHYSLLCPRTFGLVDESKDGESSCIVIRNIWERLTTTHFNPR